MKLLARCIALASVLLASDALAGSEAYDRLMARGHVLAMAGRLGEAAKVWKKAVAQAQNDGDDRDIAAAAEAAGTMLTNSDASGAKKMFDLSLKHYRALGDIDGMKSVHGKLSKLTKDKSHKKAIAALEDGRLPGDDKDKKPPKRATPPPRIKKVPRYDDDDSDADTWLGLLIGVASVVATGMAIGIAIRGSSEDAEIGVMFPPGGQQ